MWDPVEVVPLDAHINTKNKNVNGYPVCAEFRCVENKTAMFGRISGVRATTSAGFQIRVSGGADSGGREIKSTTSRVRCADKKHIPNTARRHGCTVAANEPFEKLVGH